MNPIKLEVELYEVQNGKIKKLRYKDKIISVSSIEEYNQPETKTEMKPVEKLGGQLDITPKQPNNRTVRKPKNKPTLPGTVVRGEKVGTEGHNTIFRKPLEWMKENIDTADTETIYQTFRRFYPGRKENSIKTYISSYKRFLRGPNRETRNKYGEVIGTCSGTLLHKKTVDLIEKTDKSREAIRNVVDNVYRGTKLSTRRTYARGYYKYFQNGRQLDEPKQKTSSNASRTKPSNAIGKSKKYQILIKKDEYLAVKRAINKWNFNATTNSIHELTNIPKQRVRATLDYMLGKHEIYMKYEDAVPLYKPV